MVEVAGESMVTGELVEQKTDGDIGDWASVAAMADDWGGNRVDDRNKVKFEQKLEKPEDDLNVVDEAIYRYLHSDENKKTDFYRAIMEDNEQRWYPEIKSTRNTPEKVEFEQKMFKKWQNSIANMGVNIAIARYGNGKTFQTLKKLHNYIKTGHTANTQMELLINCFGNDDEEFDNAFEYLRYDRHSDPGWMYYSSRDTSVGMEEPMEVDGRFYLNIEPTDSFDVANKFVDACEEASLPYEFKINRRPERSDVMVFYSSEETTLPYADILANIMRDPKINKRAHQPPLLTQKIDAKIGYGDERPGLTYNERQAEKFKTAIESVAYDYAREIGPQLIEAGVSGRDLVKRLLMANGETFTQRVQEKLKM